MAHDVYQARAAVHDALASNPPDPPVGGTDDVGVLVGYVVVTEWATIHEGRAVRTLSLLSGGPDSEGPLTPWARDGMLHTAIHEFGGEEL